MLCAENQNWLTCMLGNVTNYVLQTICKIIADCSAYKEAIELLQVFCRILKNEILVQHLLATRWQKNGESLEHDLQELWALSKDCNFWPMTAKQTWDKHTMDTGEASEWMIKKRKLENSVETAQNTNHNSSGLKQRTL